MTKSVMETGPSVVRRVSHGLVRRGDRYLLLHRLAGRYQGGQWDIPGGTVEQGETPHEAAGRECQEETGLVATVGALVAHYENDDTEGRALAFHTDTFELSLATGEEPVVALAPQEHDDFAWATVAEALTFPLVWHVRLTFERLLD
jgi:8-oxo-dGTP diphosphatase